MYFTTIIDYIAIQNRLNEETGDEKIVLLSNKYSTCQLALTYKQLYVFLDTLGLLDSKFGVYIQFYRAEKKLSENKKNLMYVDLDKEVRESFSRIVEDGSLSYYICIENMPDCFIQVHWNGDLILHYLNNQLNEQFVKSLKTKYSKQLFNFVAFEQHMEEIKKETLL